MRNLQKTDLNAPISESERALIKEFQISLAKRSAKIAAGDFSVTDTSDLNIIETSTLISARQVAGTQLNAPLTAEEKTFMSALRRSISSEPSGSRLGHGGLIQGQKSGGLPQGQKRGGLIPTEVEDDEEYDEESCDRPRPGRPGRPGRLDV
jgi:hypothetical protein